MKLGKAVVKSRFVILIPARIQVGYCRLKPFLIFPITALFPRQMKHSLD